MPPASRRVTRPWADPDVADGAAARLDPGQVGLIDGEQLAKSGLAQAGGLPKGAEDDAKVARGQHGLARR